MTVENKQDEEQKNVPPSSQEDIAAAIARAYGKSGNADDINAALAQTTKNMNNAIPSERNLKTKGNKRNYAKPAPEPKKPQPKVLEEDGNFVVDTYVPLTAANCHKTSLEHEDKMILKYIESIDKKIARECSTGGFSTNVSFRVMQNDWVNVNRIMDYYRLHGFDVLNYEMSTPPYGTSGAIQHDFTISWVNPH